MHLPHTLLTLAAAGGLWLAGHLWSSSQTSLRPPEKPFCLAIPGSGYGSLVARLMRDSLYTYWHGGEAAVSTPPRAKAKEDHDHSPPPPPPPGRFSRLGRPVPTPPQQQQVQMEEEAPQSWLDRTVGELVRLENARYKRNGSGGLSAAHQRYINASASWRLRLACELDPGDAVLYEILHFHLTTQGRMSEAAERAVDELAAKVVRHGLSPTASMSDALGGAGAALNRLNDELLRARGRSPMNVEILANWSSVMQCLDRYRTVRQQAVDEGWWEGIPEIRREEITAHARTLENITGTVRKTLINRQILPKDGS